MYSPKKYTPAQVHYVDVAGVAKGGKEGSRANVLSALRTVDALLHVVRAFESDAVAGEGADPVSDASDFDLELTMADLEVIERRRERLEREVRAGRTEGQHELAVLVRCTEALNDEIPLRSLEFSDEESRLIKGYQFLTQKPAILVINVGEEKMGQADGVLADFAAWADIPKTEVIVLSAEIEMEIAELEEADRPEFLGDLGIEEAAIDRLVHVSYELLDLISFFTVGEDEVRAWTLGRGSTAIDAAAAIHTDLARGFIRAETIAYADLAAAGSMSAAKEQGGVVRLEGKTYGVKDGDIINIRFNI
jgi:ribosome-binding ATPase